MFNKQKFEEILKEKFLEIYEDDNIIKENEVYSLAYTTSEDEKDEYQLNFDSKKMELQWFKNNKKIYKENYNFDEIIQIVEENDLIDILLENIKKKLFFLLEISRKIWYNKLYKFEIKKELLNAAP